MHHHKQPERRTFLQDRLEILIKRQKAGTATFNELTELDAIVNADPEIRDRIIRESFFPDEIIGSDGGQNDILKEENVLKTPPQRYNWLQRIKAFINRIFSSLSINTKPATSARLYYFA